MCCIIFHSAANLFPLFRNESYYLKKITQILLSGRNLIRLEIPNFAKISEIKSISKPLMIVDRNLHPLTEFVTR